MSDVVSFRRVTEPDAISFLDRIGDIRRRWSSLALIPVFIAAGYSENAWKLLRSQGVAAITTSDVLGKSLNRLLLLFENALSARNAEEISVSKVSDLLEYSESVSEEDGIVGNLKGAVFELIVAMFYRGLGFDVTLQKSIRKPGNDGNFEIDVVAVKADRHAILVECKGRNKNAMEDPLEIERHFKDRFGAADDPYGWHVTNLYKRVDVVFISLGKVEDSWRPTQPKTGIREIGVNRFVKDRQEFIEMLSNENQFDLKKLVERFF